jgi:hypothetical protein
MWKSQAPNNIQLIVPPDLLMSMTLTRIYDVNSEAVQLSDTLEQKSRLVSLVYRVLGTIELPPVEASEGEVLAVLASAFHRRAQVAVEAELDRPQGKPALPEYSMFSSSRR